MQENAGARKKAEGEKRGRDLHENIRDLRFCEGMGHPGEGAEVKAVDRPVKREKIGASVIADVKEKVACEEKGGSQKNSPGLAKQEAGCKRDESAEKNIVEPPPVQGEEDVKVGKERYRGETVFLSALSRRSAATGIRRCRSGCIFLQLKGVGFYLPFCISE